VGCGNALAFTLNASALAAFAFPGCAGELLSIWPNTRMGKEEKIRTAVNLTDLIISLLSEMIAIWMACHQREHAARDSSSGKKISYVMSGESVDTCFLCLRKFLHDGNCKHVLEGK
jgi:hypothetical protein